MVFYHRGANFALDYWLCQSDARVDINNARYDVFKLFIVNQSPQSTRPFDLSKNFLTILQCCEKYDEELFHDGGPYNMRTSPLIYFANQWNGFYMIGTSVKKRVKDFSEMLESCHWSLSIPYFQGV